MWRRIALAQCCLLGIVALHPREVRAASLKPETVKAWDEYIQAARDNMQHRLSSGRSFLWSDESPDMAAIVRGGGVAVAPASPHMPKRVPSGLIHDWNGAVFVPHATIRVALRVLRDYAKYPEIYRPHMIAAKPLAIADGVDRFSVIFMNKSYVLKSALDVDYETAYFRVDERRNYSISRSTRIQEIEDYAQAGERKLPEGQGKGFIWKLSTITRLEERDGGLYIEVEAIALSRDLPLAIRWMADSIVRRVSRDAIVTGLQQTAAAVRSGLKP